MQKQNIIIISCVAGVLLLVIAFFLFGFMAAGSHNTKMLEKLKEAAEVGGKKMDDFKDVSYTFVTKVITTGANNQQTTENHFKPIKADDPKLEEILDAKPAKAETDKLRAAENVWTKTQDFYKKFSEDKIFQFADDDKPGFMSNIGFVFITNVYSKYQDFRKTVVDYFGKVTGKDGDVVGMILTHNSDDKVELLLVTEAAKDDKKIKELSDKKEFKTDKKDAKDSGFTPTVLNALVFGSQDLTV